MDDETTVVDLNQANEVDLAALPGIGGALAERIVQYRETNGSFVEVADLTAVPGISNRMVEGLTDHVIVTPSAPETEPESPTEDSTAENDIPRQKPVFGVPEQAEAEEIEPEMNEEIPPSPTETAPSATESRSPQSTTAVAAATSRNMTVSQRRGCILILLGSLLGAMVGVVLTLALLAALNNGSLFYNQPDQQLQREMNAARSSLATLEAANSDLAGQVSTAESNMEALTTYEAQSRETLTEVQVEVTAVQTEIDTLEERIDTVDDAAETINTFLLGLRDLLGDLDHLPTAISPLEPTVTLSVTITSTPTAAATITDTETTLTPTITATRRPTRTPIPTATPLASPTNTPAPQP